MPTRRPQAIALFTALIAVYACNGNGDHGGTPHPGPTADQSPPWTLPAPVVDPTTLSISADARVVRVAGGNELWTQITLTNTAAHPGRITHSGDCEVTVRLHPAAPARPAWSGPATLAMPDPADTISIVATCSDVRPHLILPPGLQRSPHALRGRLALGHLKDDGVEEGTYDVNLRFEINEEEVEVRAGPVRVAYTAGYATPLAEGTLTAWEATVRPGAENRGPIEIEATGRNRTERELVVAHADVPPRPWLSREGERVWSAERWPDAPITLRAHGPPERPEWQVLSPGERLRGAPFRIGVPRSAILGDSLPPGEYDVQVDILLYTDTVTVPAGRIRLP